MASVAINDVRKLFGQVEVIKGLSLDIGEGEFVALVGPSGCGKSTLLRMIAGLEDVSEGEIRIGGRVVNDIEPKDRDVAMVFQSYALYPHMTVAENLSFALRLKKTPADTVDGRIRQAAQMLGLADLLKRLPRQLSGGQRQRVAMGRALVRNPQVFLFDEPLSNLDAKLRVQMRAEIKKLHQTLKVTTVYVTHDQMEAMTLADRVVVLQGGVIEQAGRPLELYDRPANAFVAGFIGSPAMNLLPGRISADGTDFEVQSGATLPLPEPLPALAGRPVTLGIRPEHLAVSKGSSGAPAKALVIEPTGAETHAVLDLDGQELTTVFRERLPIAPGEIVAMSIAPGSVHLFDPGSGRRL
ncbi:sn-glycerol-3-phosphate ABC transporter ATP-binding protein UgpC [Nordella sp. HKS 07]|uniref:ABC transporter ATP-binding protein n=1 Tax=Nordella sp. HKS 07 TaxID=2712222 RepID=UPI0013E1EB7F|nr:sn-glycerol-3-phosphate ABC transporter ATP-binding protein UgpC [Nordella sp. HKS 07]QIG47843.1 sn-glycerol-3-phosphate ABC transporter ATP-binding protein UgpC [Nordella sp. HKS 07]